MKREGRGSLRRQRRPCRMGYRTLENKSCLLSRKYEASRGGCERQMPAPCPFAKTFAQPHAQPPVQPSRGYLFQSASPSAEPWHSAGPSGRGWASRVEPLASLVHANAESGGQQLPEAAAAEAVRTAFLREMGARSTSERATDLSAGSRLNHV